MTVNRKPTGTASSLPGGLAWGAAASLAMTLAGTAVTAELINAGTMQWENSGYAVMAIILLSAWTGAAAAAGRIKRRRLMVCLSSGGLYYVLLLSVTALFFGGQYSGAGETLLLVFCGSMLGVLLGIRQKNGRNFRRSRVRSG